jgi:hypothetical protein
MLSNEVLAYYLPYYKTRIETNVSNRVVAGVLLQLQENSL